MSLEPVFKLERVCDVKALIESMHIFLMLADPALWILTGGHDLAQMICVARTAMV